MPKMKTSRAAAKRFKVTGTGKLKRNKAYKRHILTFVSSVIVAFLRFLFVFVVFLVKEESTNGKS